MAKVPDRRGIAFEYPSSWVIQKVNDNSIVVINYPHPCGRYGIRREPGLFQFFVGEYPEALKGTTLSEYFSANRTPSDAIAAVSHAPVTLNGREMHKITMDVTKEREGGSYRAMTWAVAVGDTLVSMQPVFLDEAFASVAQKILNSLEVTK